MSFIYETADYAVQTSEDGSTYEVVRKDSGIVQASEPVLSVNLYNCVNMQKVMGMFLYDGDAVRFRTDDSIGVLSQDELDAKITAEVAAEQEALEAAARAIEAEEAVAVEGNVASISGAVIREV